MTTIKQEIRNRWTNAVQFTADITCAPDATIGVRIGLAVMWARQNDANLRDADLSGADLSDAYLSGANLSGAYLRGANLRGANLRGADLSGANLSDAYLSDAYLSDANLSDAYLSGAYLRGANLRGANLRDADLSGADLRGANLRDANLSDAYLRGAYLRGANLSGAVGKFSTFQGGKHDAWAAAGKAAIGCHWHTIEYWQENYRKIGADNGYTEAEIERYGAWIMGLDWLKLPKEGDGND